MFGSHTVRRLMGGLMVLALGSVAACDDDSVSTPAVEGLTPEVEQALHAAIQDEYRAENIYLRVLADFGDVVPFRNIVYAEERHSQALAWLFVRRDLEVPLSEWDLTNVPSFPSVSAACQAGVEAEQANISLYDDLFALPLPSDARRVFENNRAASLDRHLPAFQACS